MSGRGVLVLVTAGLMVGCGSGDSGTAQAPSPTPEPTSSVRPAATQDQDGVVKIDGDRGLYVRCSGSGSPTVVMEGGDEDTSDSYAYAEQDLAKVTRSCVYDRANLGQSDPAPGPRQLDDYVGDLEKLLAAARIEAPYVLVGTSGGGYLAAGYAVEHRRYVAGMVLIDTGRPLDNPPKEIVDETDPENPENVEKRDYLQIENDAWTARRRIGDIPMSIISVKFSQQEIRESPFAIERQAMKRNVARQRGWLVLSPRGKQIVTTGGHAVEEGNPELVVKTILDVVKEARR